MVLSNLKIKLAYLWTSWCCWIAALLITLFANFTFWDFQFVSVHFTWNMRFSQFCFSLILSILSWQMNEGFFMKAFNNSIQIRNCSDIPAPCLALCSNWTQCPQSKYMMEHGLVQCYQAERQHWLEGKFILQGLNFITGHFDKLSPQQSDKD